MNFNFVARHTLLNRVRSESSSSFTAAYSQQPAQYTWSCLYQVTRNQSGYEDVPAMGQEIELLLQTCDFLHESTADINNYKNISNINFRSYVL